MRYLGIDYGHTKVGLALSDESGVLAFPHAAVPNDGTLRSTLTQLLEREGVTDIVIGHSRNNAGDDNPVMLEISGLKDALERGGYGVHLEPEFYTSAQARRSSPGAVDASAAALILQSFLDREREAA